MTTITTTEREAVRAASILRNRMWRDQALEASRADDLIGFLIAADEREAMPNLYLSTFAEGEF